MAHGSPALSTAVRTAQLDRIGESRPVVGVLLAAELLFSRAQRRLFRCRIDQPMELASRMDVTCVIVDGLDETQVKGRHKSLLAGCALSG